MSTPQLGVLQQMWWEAQAADAQGIPWRTAVYGSEAVAASRPEVVHRATVEPGFASGGRAKRLAAWLRWRRSFYAWLEEQAADVDVVLLRHTLHDPLRARALLRIGVPVLGVHHTLEVPELLAGQHRIAAAAESLFGRAALKRSGGVIAVTDEILRYERGRVRDEVPGQVYPNGTIIPDLELPGSVPDGPEPHILFVADEFAPWHGLDRLLASLSSCQQRLVLHLVGSLAPEDEEVARRDPRAILHGRKSPAEISALASTCSVGLTSFAFDRKNMTQACTLKVREYLQQGLPVYAGHQDVIPPAFPYLRSGPADVGGIVDFARAMGGVARSKVRDEAAPYIDKRALLAELYRWLDEHAQAGHFS